MIASHQPEVNGIAEADMFVLGDSDDEGDGDPNTNTIDVGPVGPDFKSHTTTEPPPYDDSSPSIHHRLDDEISTSLSSLASGASEPTSSDPFMYYIQPGDTLSSISLKLGIDVRICCHHIFNSLSDHEPFIAGEKTSPSEQPTSEHPIHNSSHTPYAPLS